MNKLEFTKYLAKEAGKLILEYLGKPIIAQSKRDVEIITEADTAVEKFLSRIIKQSDYNFPILSEETFKADVNSENLWIIDPVDGTTNFFKKNPRFSCSIGLSHKGVVIIGVVYNPCTKEIFYAEKDKGVYLNDKRLSVSQVHDLPEAVICIDSDYDSSKARKRVIRVYACLAPPVTRGIRQTASCALDLSYVASGKFDAYVCPLPQDLYAWDIAAGGLILEEAGGKLTDFSGKKWDLKLTDRLASNGYLHNDLIEILKSL